MKKSEKAADEIKVAGNASRFHPSQEQFSRAMNAGQEHTGAYRERTGKGPGSRPMRIPKEPTTHVPKKSFMKKIKDMASQQLGWED